MLLNGSWTACTPTWYGSPVAYNGNYSRNLSYNNGNQFGCGAAGTIVSWEIDADGPASDSTLILHLYINGINSGTAITMLIGTSTTFISGLSIAIARGDILSIKCDAGYSNWAGSVDSSIRFNIT